MKTIIFMVVVCGAALAQDDARESRTVRTAQGPVRGYKSDEVYRFYGIPYATAPTGKDRYKAPLPGPVWMQPLEAVNNKILCPVPDFPLLQIDLSTYNVQENCLVANVFAPDTEETNLPVLVYVHGGGYHVGWGDMQSPHNIVKQKKIVAVTFNYRLGVHGFLCLGTEGAPGNAGMKDQVALLRWVHKNIASFGGNPDDVTIAGASAGSSAVELLMLSETTKGLYNKVIPESGASIAPGSVTQDPVQNAKDFAKSRNFTKFDDVDALEEFYTTAPFDVILYSSFLDRKDFTVLFSPCVERNIGVETFLEDNPVNILKSGNYRKVPVLYGFANMEGLLRIPYAEKWMQDMNERFSDFLPADLQFNSEQEKEEVAQIIKEFYFGEQPVSEETVVSYVDYFGDVMFTYPHLRSTRLQVEAGSDSIYLYQYSYYTPPPKSMNLPKIMDKLEGADHCAQSGAVYDFHASEYLLSTGEEYAKVRERMRELWGNFITTGKPVPEGSDFPAWPPAGANRAPHMDLGKEMKLKGPLLEKRALFWDGIYEKYYRTPLPPTRSPVRNEL